MPIRVVFCDMDGTFLTRDKRVLGENLALLDRLAEKGVPFVPCSGRIWRGLPAEVLAHPATRYAIGSDGAVVMGLHDAPATAPDTASADERPAMRLHLSSMGVRRTRELYERVRDLPVTFDVLWDGRVYSERRRLELLSTFPIEPHDLRTRRIGNHYAIELHILMDGGISLKEAHDKASEVEDILRQRYGEETHVVVHVEPKEG